MLKSLCIQGILHLINKFKRYNRRVHWSSSFVLLFSVYFGVRLVLRQIFNSIIAIHNRQELSQNHFLLEAAANLLKVVKSKPVEVLSRSNFWIEIAEFVDHSSGRTYERFQKIMSLHIMQISVEETDSTDSFDVHTENDSLIDFYHQFLILCAILDSGSLKDNIIEILRYFSL